MSDTNTGESPTPLLATLTAIAAERRAREADEAIDTDADPFDDEPEAPEAPPAPAPAPAAPKVPDHEGFSFEQATKAGEALRRAARGCPVRQIRYMLNRMAREWEHAAAGVDGEDELTIECLGSISPGMQVPVSREYRGDETTERGTVIRMMTRDGQTSLHIEVSSDPKPIYENYASPGSPVVVFK